MIMLAAMAKDNRAKQGCQTVKVYSVIQSKQEDRIKEFIRRGKSQHKLLRPHFYNFIQLLEENKIMYYADRGTLLGAVRNQHEIIWDDDYDLYMPLEEVEQLRELIRPYGFVLKDYKGFLKVFAHDIEDTITDIFYQQDNSWKTTDPLKISTVIKMKFGDIDINVMNNYDEYLTELYGSKYMTEYHIYNHTIQRTYAIISPQQYQYFEQYYNSLETQN